MADKKDIFSTKIVPIMDKVYDELQQKKEKEYVEELKSSTTQYSALMSGQFSASVATHVAHQNVKTHGIWNSKNSEDYINMIKSELKNQGIKYNSVTEKKMIEHLVAKNIPTSSAEYIIKKAYSETLFGVAESARDSALDKHVKQEAEEKYNPSTKETIVAGSISTATNYAATAGVGGIWGQSAVDGTIYLANIAGKNDYQKEEQKRAINEVSETLKKQVSVPKWMYEKTGVESLEKTPYESLKKLYTFAQKNSNFYATEVQKAIESGDRVIRVSKNSPEISITEATLRVKQYDAFAAQIKEEFTRRQVKDVTSKQVSVPKWMYERNGLTSLSSASTDKLERVLNYADSNAKKFQNTLDSAIADHKQKIIVKNEALTIPQFAIRVKEYEVFAGQIREELENRKTASQVAVNHPNQEQSYIPQAESSLNIESSSPPQSQNQYDGWNNLLGSLGLDGMGNTINHLGFNLAMLPDMLVGAFTGDTKSLGMNKGTMMPLAAIMIALFAKNPLIKFPLLLLGGANLFNKVSKEAMDEHQEKQNFLQNTPSSLQYKKYSDELLNERIKNPVLQGDKLIMDIDKTPRIITLPSNIVEAYNQGALPLNTIANRVLTKYDQTPQQQTNIAEGVSANLTRQYQQNQEQEQSRGIR